MGDNQLRHYKINHMQLTDFARKFFTGAVHDIDADTKRRFAFIMVRLVSIKYPTAAQIFNTQGVDRAHVIDYLSTIMKRQHNRTPSWVWTKYDKTKSDAKKKIGKYSEAMELYANFMMLSQKDLDYHLEMNNEQTMARIKSIHSSLNTKK